MCLFDKHFITTTTHSQNFGKMKKQSTTIQAYSTRVINMNFRIKVYGRDENGKRINTLVGVSGLINLIGIELFNKLISKAFNSLLDCFVAKLRRGLKISFYNK